jgi:hypothetical protein
MRCIDEFSDPTFLNSQLAKLPPNEPKSNRHFVDRPSQAARYETKLRDGDIIVAFVRCSDSTELCTNFFFEYRPMDYQTTSFRLTLPPSALL